MGRKLLGTCPDKWGVGGMLRSSGKHLHSSLTFQEATVTIEPGPASIVTQGEQVGLDVTQA